MRKQTGLVIVVLACSLIILMQIVAISVRANGIQADVKVNPASLLLTEEGNQGNWVFIRIRFPKDYDVNNIDLSSVTLAMESVHVAWSIYDIQGNTLMIKLERSWVINMLLSMEGHMSPLVKQEVRFEVFGILHDGTLVVQFQGSDTIRVFIIEPPEP